MRIPPTFAAATAALLLVVLALPGATAFAEELVPNPEYEGWASFRVGATVRIESETSVEATKSVTRTTTQLLEVASDRLVLESTVTTISGGKELTAPVRKREVPSKISKDDLPKPDPSNTKEGDEELDVGGRKVACHFVEVTRIVDGKKSVTKTWTSKEVPGGLVKMESTTEGTPATTARSLAIDWKVPSET